MGILEINALCWRMACEALREASENASHGQSPMANQTTNGKPRPSGALALKITPNTKA